MELLEKSEWQCNNFIQQLALEKLLRHHTIEGTSSVQSDCTVVDDSSHPKTPLKDAYAFFQELFGDSLSIKLPCIDFSSKNTSSQEQVTLVLPGKELPEMTGDSLLSGLMDEGKDRSSTEDVAIKATLSDPLHGIKLKISKCSKQTKDVVLESASDGTFGETKSKKASSGSKRNSSSVITSEMFDEMPLKNREDVIISFRFRNQSNLNTFTEKKKAQILARNMTRQYASTSRYRELCNNLKPYSKSSLLFKQLHTKNVGLHSFVPNAACMVWVISHKEMHKRSIERIISRSTIPNWHRIISSRKHLWWFLMSTNQRNSLTMFCLSRDDLFGFKWSFHVFR